MGKTPNLKRNGNEAFLKVEKKAPPSLPGLEPGSPSYAADALPLELLGRFRFNLSPFLQFSKFSGKKLKDLSFFIFWAILLKLHI